MRAVEASLRRLGTDRIDILYLHHYDTGTALDDTLQSLELLVQQGKILYPAASNFAAWQIVRALGIADRRGWAPLACLQPMYNLAKRQAEVEILPMARELGAGRVHATARSPAACSPASMRDKNAEGRLKTNAAYKVRYGEASNYDIAAGLGALAEELGHHPASVAVAWVASHPAVTAPILGARNLEQLEPSLKALDVKMEGELRERVSKLSPTPPPANDRLEERR